jgi:hypothetical protein
LLWEDIADPRVAISGKTIVISAVLGNALSPAPRVQGAPVNRDLVAWRSVDDGRTWSKPVTINDSPASAREGLHAMAVGARGEIAAVWLDDRAKVKQLYGARSRDRGKTWSKNELLYAAPGGTICECCDPSVVADGSGFLTMFRNVVNGARDMYVLPWNGEGQTGSAQKLGKGTWIVDACPMDGGGIAVRGKEVVTAWRREQTVFLDRPGETEMSLGHGKDVALVLTRAGAYIAWSAKDGLKLHVPGKQETLCLAKDGGAYPVLSTLSNGHVLAAWSRMEHQACFAFRAAGESKFNWRLNSFSVSGSAW